MLVLSRRMGEAIHIGDQIVVCVTQISGNRVTIGVVAPKDVRILRGELAPLKSPNPAPIPNETGSRIDWIEPTGPSSAV